MKHKKVAQNAPSDADLKFLDESSILRLELMDLIIESKKQMEISLQNGYLMLGKARYIMGVQSVSMLQVPSEECDIETLYYTTTAEEPFDEMSLISSAHFDIHRYRKPLIQEKTDDGEKDISNVRKRRGSKVVDIEEENKSVVVEAPEKELEPLNWFSALPPQSLRQAQKYFREAIEKSAECATLYSKLNSVNKRYKAIQVSNS